MAVDHKRKRVVWAHDGYGKEVLDLFFEELTPEQRASIRCLCSMVLRPVERLVFSPKER